MTRYFIEPGKYRESLRVLRETIPGPVKFPVNRPGKLSGPVVTGSFEKRAPGLDA